MVGIYLSYISFPYCILGNFELSLSSCVCPSSFKPTEIFYQIFICLWYTVLCYSNLSCVCVMRRVPFCSFIRLHLARNMFVTMLSRLTALTQWDFRLVVCLYCMSCNMYDKKPPGLKRHYRILTYSWQPPTVWPL